MVLVKDGQQEGSKTPLVDKLDVALKTVQELKESFPSCMSVASVGDAKDAFTLIEAIEKDLKWTKVELYRQWESMITIKFKV